MKIRSNTSHSIIAIAFASLVFSGTSFAQDAQPCLKANAEKAKSNYADFLLKPSTTPKDFAAKASAAKYLDIRTALEPQKTDKTDSRDLVAILGLGATGHEQQQPAREQAKAARKGAETENKPSSTNKEDLEAIMKKLLS